jgi:DNA gyrase subunit A
MPDEELMIITRNGVVNRQRVDEIRVIGRATQGVRLMNLEEGDEVMDVAKVITEDEGDIEGDGSSPEEGGSPEAIVAGETREAPGAGDADVGEAGP